MVHQVRNSLKYVAEKDRKAAATSPRTIHTVPAEAAARAGGDRAPA
jgi:transposase-like protein